MLDRKKVVLVCEKSFIFISDENGLMISDTRECLVLVISSYSFVYIFVKFGFVSDHVCDFAITFTMNVIKIY